MPKIKSCCDNSVIELSLNLHGTGLIYERDQEDYLNWIPYKLELTGGNNKHVLDGVSFSLEGVKNFLKKMDFLINERNITTEYQTVSYCGCEAEFEIVLKNTEEDYDGFVILTDIWLNSARTVIEQSWLNSVKTVVEQPGYFVGYRFLIKYDDFRQFVTDLKKQLQELLLVDLTV